MTIASYPDRPPRRGRPCPCGGHPLDAPAFVPLCMDAEELGAWNAANRITSGKQRALRPCDDCTLGHAANMRAEGRCNGSPRAIADDG